MTDILIKKKFYRIEFELESPLAIGSGQNVLTDKDIIRDARGIPFIPGSAMAGLGRSILKKYEPSKDTSDGNALNGDDVVQKKEDSVRAAATATDQDMKGRPEEDGIDDSPWLQHYLGYVKISTEKNTDAWSYESRIIFYDARIREEDELKIEVSERDGVGLDEWKTARKGAKYDYEIIEPGVRFATIIEQDIYDNQGSGDNIKSEKKKDRRESVPEIDDPVADLIAKEWLTPGSVYLGAKTSRGYGEVKNVVIITKEFDFKNAESVREYAAFDPFNSKAWNAAHSFKCDSNLQKWLPKSEDRYPLKLRLRLSLDGVILIRKYSTQAEDGKTLPDFSQLCLHGSGSKQDSVPVIPGTSWAGAFRAQMERLIPGSTEGYFGLVDRKNKQKKKSAIRFSETRVVGSRPKQISRNAIDRFSGGTVDGALFTEEAWYGSSDEPKAGCEKQTGTGGECTVLEISFGKDTSDVFDRALAASIADLHFGFMTVGGAASVGRGRFKIRSINGEEIKTVTEESGTGNAKSESCSIYNQILSEIRKLKGENDG